MFFGYYNHEHRHSGIGLHTPASVHYGTADEIRAQRQHTLDAAYAAHPERFGNRRPRHRNCPPPPGSTNPHRRPSYRPRNETCLRLLDIFRDANQYGDFIVGKHKSDIGTFIPWKEPQLITSAEEFLALRTSEDPTDQDRATRDNADVSVWLEVVTTYPSMRQWVAHNKTVPSEVLQTLASDPDPAVRWEVAGKRKLDPDSLAVWLRTVTTVCGSGSPATHAPAPTS